MTSNNHKWSLHAVEKDNSAAWESPVLSKHGQATSENFAHHTVADRAQTADQKSTSARRHQHYI